jgi:hypothetical protein
MDDNKNCRNEAKKYLKTRELLKNRASKAEKLLETRHIALLNAASLAHFVRKCSTNYLKTSSKHVFLAPLFGDLRGLHEA